MPWLQTLVFRWGRRNPAAFAAQLGHPSGLRGRLVGHLLNRAQSDHKRRAVRRLEVRRDSRVLDLGFGGGVALEELAALAPDGLVAGVEISEEMIRGARRRFRREIRAGAVEVRKGSAEAIPYRDASFDAVVSMNSIYFWPDPLAGLREIGRVLRPGGQLVLLTGEKATMERMPWVRHGFQTFDGAELEQLTRRAGFAQVAVETHASPLGAALLTLATRPDGHARSRAAPGD